MLKYADHPRVKHIAIAFVQRLRRVECVCVCVCVYTFIWFYQIKDVKTQNIFVSCLHFYATTCLKSRCLERISAAKL